MQKFIIDIPSPCHEPWDEMQPQRFGKFCSSCQKTVVDFSNATDSEITRHLATHPNTCGRFRANQLQKTYAHADDSTSFIRKKWLWFLGFLVAQLTSLQTGAQNKPPVKPQSHQVVNAEKKHPVKNKGYVLKGKVLDSEGKPFWGVNIFLRRNGKVLFGTYTDTSGNFQLKLPHIDLKNARLSFENEFYGKTILRIQNAHLSGRPIEVKMKEPPVSTEPIDYSQLQMYHFVSGGVNIQDVPEIVDQDSGQVKPYLPFASFNGDTLEYLCYNLIERKRNYKGKPLNKMLDDLEIPMKSWLGGGPSTNRYIANYIRLYPDDKQTKEIKFRRDKPFEKVKANIYGIEIVWREAADKEINDKLMMETDGEWSQAVLDYYGTMVIRTIKVYRVDGPRYE